jgi:hypothetical protein
MFVYLDDAVYDRADLLLRTYQLEVRYKDAWLTPDRRYRIIFCTVPKKQARRFKEAMAEMPERMKMLGYEDYSDFWTEMIRALGDRRAASANA